MLLLSALPVYADEFQAQMLIPRMPMTENEIFGVVKEITYEEAVRYFSNNAHTIPNYTNFGYHNNNSQHMLKVANPVGGVSNILWVGMSSYLDDVESGIRYDFGEAYFTLFDKDGKGAMAVGEQIGLGTEADYKYKYYEIQLKKAACVSVFLDGEGILFDQSPVIEDGRTLVPLRQIFEKLGAKVDWDGATSTVTATKDNTVVKLTVGNTVASKNGETITIDVPAKIINGRTFVPVRFIADCFGVKTDWNATLKQVILTSN